MGNTPSTAFRTVRGQGTSAAAPATAVAEETQPVVEAQSEPPQAEATPVNGTAVHVEAAIPAAVETDVQVPKTVRAEPARQSPIDAAIAKGMAAIVPLEWLERMLSTRQAETIIERRTIRRGRRTAAAKVAATKVAKRAVTTVEEKVDGRKGKIGGLYSLTSKNRETVRGRDTIKRVHEYMKAHPSGVTAKQIMEDLHMPSSTVQYTLGKLQEKQAVNYKRAK